jgi:hypothetical protein
MIFDSPKIKLKKKKLIVAPLLAPPSLHLDFVTSSLPALAGE